MAIDDVDYTPQIVDNMINNKILEEIGFSKAEFIFTIENKLFYFNFIVVIK